MYEIYFKRLKTFGHLLAIFYEIGHLSKKGKMHITRIFFHSTLEIAMS